MNRIALSLASLVLALAMTTYAHADDHKVAMDGKCPVWNL